MRSLGALLVAAAALALLLVAPGAASAHVTKPAGPYRIEIGWSEEPARVGSPNAVEVTVLGADGEPLAVPAGALSVEVSYADTAVTLPLVPTESLGTLEAQLTPTRPGAYAFAVSGRVRGRQVQVRAACSASTFNCVEGSAGPQFPVKEPSPGQLAQRLGSEAARVASANKQADDARTIALFAAIAAALGLILGGAALVAATRGRRRRKAES